MSTNNELPLTVTVAQIPAGDYTPQELAEAIGSRFTISSGESFALIVQGATAPTSNIGLWFNTNANALYRWDDDSGAYVPLTIPSSSFGYVVSASEPDPAVFPVWLVIGSSGWVVDLRTYKDGAWKSMLGGTAAEAGRVPVSGSPGAAPSWKFAGAILGEIKLGFFGSVPGWLTLGSTVSRTTYSALYAHLLARGVIDATSGDGSTTFTIPSALGRVLVVAGAGAGLTTRAAGQAGGAESATLNLSSVGTPAGISYTAGGSVATGFSGSSGLAPTSLMQPFLVVDGIIFADVEA